MGFVENGDGSAPTSCGPVIGNLVELQTLEGHGEFVCGEVKGGGIGVVVVEGVLGYSSREVSGKVGCVVGVGAGFASGYQDSAVSVRARHVIIWRPEADRLAWSRRARGRWLRFEKTRSDKR